MVYFGGSPLHYNGLYVSFYASTILLWLPEFYMYFEVMRCDTSSFVLFLRIALGIWDLLSFPKNRYVEEMLVLSGLLFQYAYSQDMESIIDGLMCLSIFG